MIELSFCLNNDKTFARLPKVYTELWEWHDIQTDLTKHITPLTQESVLLFQTIRIKWCFVVQWVYSTLFWGLCKEMYTFKSCTSTQVLGDKLFNIGILTESIFSYISLSGNYGGITFIKLFFFTITFLSTYYYIRNEICMKMTCKLLVLWSSRSHVTISSSRWQIVIKEEIERGIEIEIFLVVGTEDTNV